jgi:hypothetical protein
MPWNYLRGKAARKRGRCVKLRVMRSSSRAQTPWFSGGLVER